MEHKPPVVIEATSKKFKAIQAVGVVAILIGVVALMAGASTLGGLMFFGGLIAYVYSRGAAWWHHG